MFCCILQAKKELNFETTVESFPNATEFMCLMFFNTDKEAINSPQVQ